MTLAIKFYGISSGQVWIESWTRKKLSAKNWSFCTVVLEKTLESFLDCTVIQPIHPKGYQSWVIIGKTDVETETPIFWPPDAKSWLIGKDPDAGKYWGQEEKGTTEEDMVRWHHQLSGRGLRWTPRVGDGQGGLVCCNSWCRKESDTTNKLNWLPLSFSVKTSPSVFPFVSSSLHLSTSIIYDGLDGVILWGSITVESVP